MHTPRHRRFRRRWVVTAAAFALAILLGIVLTVATASGHSSSPPTSSSPASSPAASAPVSHFSRAVTRTATTASTAPLTVARTSPARAPSAPPTTRPAAPAPSLLSSCRSVVHIGDSTSESLVSSNYLPNPEQRLTAQYSRVGASNQNMQISGARSIVETYEGQPNAYTVAQEIAASGYKGCWVVDMGVNDAANIAAGSNVGALERMRRMMSVIGSQPALWVAVRTLVASGPYADTHMQSWNTSLLQMCAAHPNMRVFNWAGEVQPAYYIPDGIHYNTPGSAILAAALADGLARAFPATRPSPASCLVP